MAHTSKDAEAISDAVVRRISDALLKNDFPLFETCVFLPYTVETFAGETVISNQEEMRAQFHAISDFYRETGVTDIVRSCVEAKFRDEITIVATHETRRLRGNELVRKPFPSMSILECRDGEWRTAKVQMAITDSEAHNNAILTRPLDAAR